MWGRVGRGGCGRHVGEVDGVVEVQLVRYFKINFNIFMIFRILYQPANRQLNAAAITWQFDSRISIVILVFTPTHLFDMCCNT